MPPDNPLEAGLAIRRAMFGAEATDRQVAAADAFTAPMQEVVSRYCFGETWTRAGLELRERSLITLGVLLALGRGPELRVHVRGALANGATPLQIRETLLHAMVYAGVPLGVDAFRNAAEALREAGIDLNTEHTLRPR